MAASCLSVLDKTMQTTHVWLGDICEQLGPDKQRAFRALKAVLHAVRDRLVIGESAHLAAQLPIFIRGVYFDGWNPADKPDRGRTRAQFIADVNNGLADMRPMDPEDACRAVFSTLNRHVSLGELDEVKNALPKAVRRLWPDADSDIPQHQTEEKENGMFGRDRDRDRNEDRSRWGRERFYEPDRYENRDRDAGDYYGRGYTGRGYLDDRYYMNEQDAEQSGRYRDRYSPQGTNRDRDYGDQGGHRGESWSGHYGAEDDRDVDYGGRYYSDRSYSDDRGHYDRDRDYSSRRGMSGDYDENRYGSGRDRNRNRGGGMSRAGQSSGDYGSDRYW